MVEFYPQTLVDYAQIIGALATSAAVITSLYIANKKPKSKLSVKCYVSILFLHNRKLKYLCISVVNIGNNDSIVNSIGWEIDSFFKEKLCAIQLTDGQDLNFSNPILPKKISHGEQIAFYLPLQGEHNWNKIIEESGMFIDRIKTRSAFNQLRAVVSTSIGESFLCKPSKDALDMMWEHQQKCLESKVKS
jgi:hypothetical protein